MEFLIKIETKNGLNMVSSRTIAEQLSKRHDNVIRDIEAILKDSSNLSRPLNTLFIESSYIHPQNKQKYKEYLLTRDGFTLYMFNIQGYNDFKMAYINRFNEMEKALSNSFDFDKLSEDEKRVFLRDQTKEHNKKLAKTAHEISNVNNYAKFHNAGYKGLYNGETAGDIKKRKQLDKKEDILDFMGSTELAANFFRITQTDERLKQGDIKTENKACEKHFEIGKKVRETMKEISGVVPEELTTPEKSVKLIKKELKKISKKNK